MALTSGWWRMVSPRTLPPDALAGLLGATLALPQGIAFALLAGLPIEMGIYSATIPCVLAAVFGSSHHVVTGPTNAISLALFASLSQIAIAGGADYVSLALAVTVMVGVIQFVVGRLHLGWVTNLISPAVLLGFVCGAAALIGLYSFSDILMIDLGGEGPFAAVVALVTDIGAFNRSALLIAAVTLATTLVVARISRRLPFMLVGIGAGFAVSELLARQTQWPAAARIDHIPSVIPALSLPEVSIQHLPDLLSIAATVAIVAMGQSISIAKIIAARSGQHIDVDREFVGQGIANIVGGFFSCYVACGSLNRSAPNYEAGARTPMAAIFSAVFLIGLALVSLPLLERIPMAAIGATLLYVAWSLLDIATFRRLWSFGRVDFWIAVITFVGMFVLPFQYVILIGSGLALAVYLNRTARPGVRTLVPDPTSPVRAFTPLDELERAFPECPHLKLVRIEGSVYFGAAGYVADKLRALRERGMQKHLLVMAKSMNFIDIAGADVWISELRQRRVAGGDLYFHRPRQSVLRVWRRTGFDKEIGEANIFVSKADAIASIYRRLDRAGCATCTARTFFECPANDGDAGSNI